MKNVMCDLETMGTGPKAAIVAKGCYDGVAHNALDDARSQARHAVRMLWPS